MEKVGCRKRAMERLSGDGLDRLADVLWKWCSQYVESGGAFVWHDEAMIEVDRVKCRHLSPRVPVPYDGTHACCERPRCSTL